MTSHELARKLLAAPDWPVVTVDDSVTRTTVYLEISDVNMRVKMTYNNPQHEEKTGNAIILS